MDSRLIKEKEIVLAQLMATSPSYKLSIGSASGMKTYTTSQLIKHVQDLDEFGKEFIETQMDFMRSFQSGDIYKMLADIES
jgi:hypothetical protein